MKNNATSEKYPKWIVGNFTLIELLVVVAIIAIIASLLLPTLNNVRDRAKAMQCVSRCKQLGQAYTMYEQSNHEYYPYYGATTGTDQEMLNNSVINLLRPYYCGKSETDLSGRGSDSVWECPSARTMNASEYAVYVGRWLNCGVHASGVGGSSAGGVKVIKFRKPSSVVVFVDSLAGDNRNDRVFFRPYYNGTGYDGGSSYTVTRKGPHKAGASFLFADGHSAVHSQSFWLNSDASLKYSNLFKPEQAGSL